MADAQDVPALTAAIRRGDAEAFAGFYEAWFGRVYAWAKAVTRRDESFCLDVVQEAMLRVVRHLKPLPTEEALARWMARATRSAAVDLLRREKRRLERESRRGIPRVAAEAPADTLELAERIRWLQGELETLPEAERVLLVARVGEEAGVGELGRASGLTADAVAGRVRRMVARLRMRAREVFDGV